mmetsp:Transcript_38475/g.70591  ORF Transcript_38475/g.70591 Transcript_38475/m.70591 type:complete len:123 (-) Transcript_38475:1720-2088(-)
MWVEASYPNINIIGIITITTILLTIIISVIGRHSLDWHYYCYCQHYHSSSSFLPSFWRAYRWAWEPAAAQAIPAPPFHTASAPKLPPKPKPVPHYPMEFCLRFSLVSLSSQERNLPPSKSTC